VPRATRHRQIQADILEAAAGIFARHGYRGTSMRDLARATGRGLSNFYNYFPSKEAALFALQSDALEMLNTSAVAAMSVSRSADAQFYAFILNHVRYITAHRDAMRVLVHESKELPVRQRRQVRSLKQRYYKIAEQIVRRILTARQTRPDAGNGSSGPRGARARRIGDADLEHATYAVFGMLNWIYGWYDPARHGSAVDLARSLHRTAVSGMKGRGPANRVYLDVELAFERLEQRSLLTR
jgi:AcrR family transcriptional regulator